MREFPTSIYGRPRSRARPTYNKVSWLQVVRAERSTAALFRKMEWMERRKHIVSRIMSDAIEEGVE